MTTRRSGAAPLLLAVALATLPTMASGQARGPSGATVGWPPIEAGVHGGLDYRSNRSVLGAQIRIPIHPSGYVELVPNGDITFLPQQKEYMAGVDVVGISGGRRGGIYAGGGITWRDALYDRVRSTKRVPTIVAGVRSPSLFGAPFSTQLEVRWVRVDTPVKPKLLTFGVNFPLWGRGERATR